MSEDLPLKATLKAGAGYDAPWLTVDGASAEGLARNLEDIINSNVVELLLSAANLLKAANNAAPLVENAPQAAAPQAPPAQKSWGQAPAAPAGGTPPPSHPNAQTHPAGETCDLGGCGKLLEFKKTQSGKSTWRCPDWRWANGNPNGHRQEWAD